MAEAIRLVSKSPSRGIKFADLERRGCGQVSDPMPQIGSRRDANRVISAALGLAVLGLVASTAGGFVSCSEGLTPGTAPQRVCATTGLMHPASGRWLIYSLLPALLFVVVTLRSRNAPARQRFTANAFAVGTILLNVLVCLAIGAMQRSLLR